MFDALSPVYVLEQEQHISRPLNEVFEFFSDARNLERLTPSFLNFEVLTEGPIAMAPGARIDYALGLYGVRFKWRTEIAEFTPNVSFVDTQERGPYALWHHTHTFEAVEGGTLMRDVVRYRLPLGPLGVMAHWIFVRRHLQRIFAYRREAVTEVFGTD